MAGQPSSSTRIAALCGAATAFLALAACAAVGKPGLIQGKSCVVAAEKAPFYRYGPAQSFGPDFQLLKGNTVLLLQRGFGFSQVLTDTGVVGFVPTEDLQPAQNPAQAADSVDPDVQPELLTGEPVPGKNRPASPDWDTAGLPKP